MTRRRLRGRAFRASPPFRMQAPTAHVPSLQVACRPPARRRRCPARRTLTPRPLSRGNTRSGTSSLSPALSRASLRRVPQRSSTSSARVPRPPRPPPQRLRRRLSLTRLRRVTGTLHPPCTPSTPRRPRQRPPRDRCRPGVSLRTRRPSPRVRPPRWVLRLPDPTPRALRAACARCRKLPASHSPRFRPATGQSPCALHSSSRGGVGRVCAPSRHALACVFADVRGGVLSSRHPSSSS